MKIALATVHSTLDGTELRLDHQTPMTLRHAIRTALEAQPVETGRTGERQARPPTMKEVMDRLEIATKLHEARDEIDLTDAEVSLVQEAALVAYTMPVAMAFVRALAT